MACKAYTLTGLNNLCKQPNFGGIKEMLVALYDDISGVTVNSGTSYLTVVMKEGKRFYQYKLPKNTASLTSTLNTSDTSASYYSNEVSVQFMKLETKKRLEVMALMLSAVAIIVKDGNNKYWFVGKDNYCECISGMAGTGTNSNDPSHYELTLSDDSHELPFEVDPTIIESLLEPAVPPTPPTPTDRYFIMNVEGDDVDISFNRKAATHYVEYSIDSGETWTEMTSATTITVLDGSSVYFRGIGSEFDTDENYDQFRFSNGAGGIECSGDIRYFWNYEHPESAITPYCGLYLFSECVNLIIPPELPSTTLAEGCYQEMFVDCSNISNPPALPATTLAPQCYNAMFNGCRTLRTAPELPAKTLVRDCYGWMFCGCSQLTYIKCLATDISAEGCTFNWVDGVANSGTFVKDLGMSSWTIGISGIPTDWTVQNWSDSDIIIE